MLTKYLAAQFSSLIQDDKRPLAVAFSGGGDSTALLYFLLQWVRCSHEPREVVALIIDHGLRASSATEAKLSAQSAHDMGAKPHILTWEGNKPTTAIQEKARKARYGLLGQACRRLGIRQLFLGHNQDDQAETIYMRIQSKTGWRGMAGMTEKKKSPLWPELYGVEIIRPMLGITRRELRDFNHEKKISYLDDPSNKNKKFTRIQIRETLSKSPELRRQLLSVGKTSQAKLQSEIHTVCLFIFRSVRFMKWGGVHLSVNNLKVSSEIIIGEVLKYLILAVSGGNQMTSKEQRQRLSKKIASKNFKGATLGGVQFIPYGEVILLVRDPGAVMGRHAIPMQTPLKLLPHEPKIWDGRFKIKTALTGVYITPLMANLEKLSKTQKHELKKIPSAARVGLPCLLSGDAVFVPYIDPQNDDYTVNCLVKERLWSLGVLRERG